MHGAVPVEWLLAVFPERRADLLINEPHVRTNEELRRTSITSLPISPATVDFSAHSKIPPNLLVSQFLV